MYTRSFDIVNWCVKGLYTEALTRESFDVYKVIEDSNLLSQVSATVYTWRVKGLQPWLQTLKKTKIWKMTQIEKRAEFEKKASLRAFNQSLVSKITTALTCESFDFYMTIALTFKCVHWRKLGSTLKLSARQSFSKIRFFTMTTAPTCESLEVSNDQSAEFSKKYV